MLRLSLYRAAAGVPEPEPGATTIASDDGVTATVQNRAAAFDIAGEEHFIAAMAEDRV